ncbi:MAG: hypothetical protein ABSD69_02360 [Candidatus Levyibacteriota bacterium]|jgi:hypothetical protein
MVTEIHRELLIRDVASSTALEQPNSIKHLEPALNEFFGWFSDDRLISEMARIVPNENSANIRRATVELIGSAWEESGAKPDKLNRIKAIFRKFYLKAGLRGIDVDTYTIGQLRYDCEKHNISKIPGVGEAAEDFFAGVVRKRTLQILQGGATAQE